MAETLFDDDDDDLWIEDPYDEADDLAEHTMHSPVLVNYDPALESAEIWTDWDDYSDEFYDSESPGPKRRKTIATGNKPKTPAKPKRQKLKSSTNVSELSLGDPASSDADQLLRPQSTVVWKSQGNSPRLPVLREGQEDKVSILKDWRERFKPSLQSLDSKSRTSDGTQRAIAVVIQHRQTTTNHTHNHTSPTTSAPHPISKRKRRHGSQNNENTHNTSQSENDHNNRPLTKKRKQGATPPTNPPTPVLTNGLSRPKRKRKRDEPTPPKSKKTSPQKPSQNITKTLTDVDGEHEGQPTAPQSHKRTRMNPQLEPSFPVKTTQDPSSSSSSSSPSGKAAATAATKGPSRTTSGRRSTRRR
ncbi:MAG: hypothetical protein LQ345_006010 [Seirophora villosa]|nr:MAG: hypothetical protein LQ345_006010 [Seirophora villosa]